MRKSSREYHMLLGVNFKLCLREQQRQGKHNWRVLLEAGPLMNQVVL